MQEIKPTKKKPSTYPYPNKPDVNPTENPYPPNEKYPLPANKSEEKRGQDYADAFTKKPDTQHTNTRRKLLAKELTEKWRKNKIIRE